MILLQNGKINAFFYNITEANLEIFLDFLEIF